MEPSLKRFTFQAMGSPCEIQLYSASRIEAKKLTRELIAEAVRLENKYSRFREDSFLSAINGSAGKTQGIALDKESFTLIQHAAACYRQSDGLFDISSGALSKLWNFRAGIVPTQDAIEVALSCVGFDKLRLEGQLLYLPVGMEIDFGGIVKEYAADSLARLARNKGVQHGLVNLGGDFSVIGRKPGDNAWPVGISDPNAPKKMMARIDVLDGGLASSGDYERCFIHKGKRYSHILNPHTGWPSSGLRAVSVAANLCTVAGSMATIAMLKPEQEGIAWLQESSLPYIYMGSDDRIAGPALQEAKFS